MHVRYKTLEHVLLVALAIGPEGRSSLNARIKRFGRLHYPPSRNVGTHKLAHYDLSDILDLALALTLLRAGMSPQLVVSFLSDHAKEIGAYWQQASAGKAVALQVRVDTMADPKAVVRGAGAGAYLRGVHVLGPWDEAEDKPLPIMHVDMTDLLKRVVSALKAVRFARILMAKATLPDELIDAAIEELRSAQGC